MQAQGLRGAEEIVAHATYPGVLQAPSQLLAAIQQLIAQQQRASNSTPLEVAPSTVPTMPTMNIASLIPPSTPSPTLIPTPEVSHMNTPLLPIPTPTPSNTRRPLHGSTNPHTRAQRRSRSAPPRSPTDTFDGPLSQQHRPSSQQHARDSDDMANDGVDAQGPAFTVQPLPRKGSFLGTALHRDDIVVPTCLLDYLPAWAGKRLEDMRPPKKVQPAEGQQPMGNEQRGAGAHDSEQREGGAPGGGQDSGQGEGASDCEDRGRRGSECPPRYPLASKLAAVPDCKQNPKERPFVPQEKSYGYQQINETNLHETFKKGRCYSGMHIWDHLYPDENGDPELTRSDSTVVQDMFSMMHGVLTLLAALGHGAVRHMHDFKKKLQQLIEEEVTFVAPYNSGAPTVGELFGMLLLTYALLHAPTCTLACLLRMRMFSHCKGDGICVDPMVHC